MWEQKYRLRAHAVERCEAFPNSEIRLWSRLVQEKVIHFPPYLDSDSVALYSPIGNEVGTEEIRDHALEKGKRLFYPKLGNRDALDLIQVESPAELSRGPSGILEPQGSQAMAEEDREGLAVFVPGVAFDIRGNRLGRGGGWYDRFLEKIGEKGRIIGLAYEFQLVEDLPVEEWDRKVHYIITEERIINCAALPSSPD